MWLQEFCVNGNNEDSYSSLYNDVQPKDKIRGHVLMQARTQG